MIKKLSDTTNEELYNLHWVDNLTTVEIEKIFGYNSDGFAVAKEFDKRGIRRRNQSEAAILSHRLHPEKYKFVEGEKHPRWRGGRRHHACGYILVNMPEHPNRHKNKMVFEHRLVMEKRIGRLLKREEIVHHLNGIKDDNREENLVIVTNKKHERWTLVKALQSRIRELEQLHLPL